MPFSIVYRFPKFINVTRRLLGHISNKPPTYPINNNSNKFQFRTHSGYKVLSP